MATLSSHYEISPKSGLSQVNGTDLDGWTVGNWKGNVGLRDCGGYQLVIVSPHASPDAPY